jgi:transcriptional regulator with XRE-family HTH domain
MAADRIFGYRFNGERLTELRESRGWSKCRLARRADTNYVSVLKWERGENTPRPDLLFRLAAALGVPPVALCDLDEAFLEVPEREPIS